MVQYGPVWSSLHQAPLLSLMDTIPVFDTRSSRDVTGLRVCWSKGDPRAYQPETWTQVTKVHGYVHAEAFQNTASCFMAMLTALFMDLSGMDQSCYSPDSGFSLRSPLQGSDREKSKTCFEMDISEHPEPKVHFTCWSTCSVSSCLTLKLKLIGRTSDMIIKP